MTHPISLATMGKFMGPHRKTITGHPPPQEVTEHEFPTAQVSNVESEDLYVKVNLLSNNDEVESNDN